MKKRESLLWQKINKALPKAHLTRIESNTLQGIPDINGVWSIKSFWIELKSDKSSFPKLSKWHNETLLERRLKLYRPLSAITDPRSLVPDFSFSFPVHWPTFREACWDLLQRPHASDALARFDTESWAQDNGKKNSLDELELSRS
jgi:hypothetical protein